MKIIDSAVMPDGTRIQLEDWHDDNTAEFPDLYGYTIGAYPIAKNTDKWGLIKNGKRFRLSVSRNKYRNYTDENVLSDYEALKIGYKTLKDLREYFWNTKKDEFYLGLIDIEPEW